MTDKKTLIIEGKEVEFTDEPNLLEVIRKAGMNVPTFCYRPDLTSFGACRMCVVEVEYPNGRKIINSSCTMPPEAGIKVYLNTEKASQEYFNVSDIEYHYGNGAVDVRVMNMT